MIPRYQRILFWSLVAGILLMAAFLLHGCEQAHKRLATPNDPTPIAAPTSSSTEDVTLYLANDADASITPATESFALPQEPSARARALIEHLLSTYSLPASAHPLQGGAAVDDVFLFTDPQPTTWHPTRPVSRHQSSRLLPRQPSLRHPGRDPHRAIDHRHPSRRLPAGHRDSLPRRRPTSRHPGRPRRPPPHLPGHRHRRQTHSTNRPTNETRKTDETRTDLTCHSRPPHT